MAAGTASRYKTGLRLETRTIFLHTSPTSSVLSRVPPHESGDDAHNVAVARPTREAGQVACKAW